MSSDESRISFTKLDFVVFRLSLIWSKIKISMIKMSKTSIDGERFPSVDVNRRYIVRKESKLMRMRNVIEQNVLYWNYLVRSNVNQVS